MNRGGDQQPARCIGQYGHDRFKIRQVVLKEPSGIAQDQGDRLKGSYQQEDEAENDDLESLLDDAEKSVLEGIDDCIVQQHGRQHHGNIPKMSDLNQQEYRPGEIIDDVERMEKSDQVQVPGQFVHRIGIGEQLSVLFHV